MEILSIHRAHTLSIFKKMVIETPCIGHISKSYVVLDIDKSSTWDV